MAVLINPSTRKVLVYNGKALITSQVLSRVLASTGGEFTSVVDTNEVLHIGGYPRAVSFELSSGQETNAYYNWGGHVQQTGFNSIFEYDDLYDYENSILSIYPANYDQLMYGPTEEEFRAAYGVTPLFVLRLRGGYWEQIA